MALAGPSEEKPHFLAALNAGTAEPMGVSPPKAVAYQVLVNTETTREIGINFITVFLLQITASYIEIHQMDINGYKCFLLCHDMNFGEYEAPSIVSVSMPMDLSLDIMLIVRINGFRDYFGEAGAAQYIALLDQRAQSNRKVRFHSA